MQGTYPGDGFPDLRTAAHHSGGQRAYEERTVDRSMRATRQGTQPLAAGAPAAAPDAGGAA